MDERGKTINKNVPKRSKSTMKENNKQFLKSLRRTLPGVRDVSGSPRINVKNLSPSISYKSRNFRSEISFNMRTEDNNRDLVVNRKRSSIHQLSKDPDKRFIFGCPSEKHTDLWIAKIKAKLS